MLCWLLMGGCVLALSLPARATEPAPAAAESTAASGRAAAVMKRLTGWTRTDAAWLAAQLQADIGRGSLEVEAQKRRILVRVLDRDAFAIGTATLRPSFQPVLDRVRAGIRQLPGEISVEGHTDDIPVNNARFRSNWELSASRAAAVAQELLRYGEFEPTRFRVVGYGTTRPLVANDTEEHRGLNRRVEIVIDQGGGDAAYLSGGKPLPAAPRPASAADELF